MAVSIADLAIRVDATQLRLAQVEADRLSNAGRNLENTANRASSAWKGLGGILASIGIGLGVRQLIEYMDTWSNLEGRLKLVTKTTEELISVQNKLFNTANATRSSFEGTIDLYSKLARAQKELGITSDQMVKITETVGKSLIISGAGAAQASAAILQLGQAFASGILAGDEYRSVAENSPRLIRAIAEGWENANGTIGVSIGKLRQLSRDQQLDIERVTAAIARSTENIDKEFSKMPVTIGQAFQVVHNELLKFIGIGGQTTGVASALADAVLVLAHNIGTITASLLTGAAAWIAYKVAFAGVSFVGFIAGIASNINIIRAHSAALIENSARNAENALAAATANISAVSASQARVAADVAQAEANLALATSNAAIVTSDYQLVQASLSAMTAQMALLRSTIAAAAAHGRHTTAIAELAAVQQVYAASLAELTALGGMQAATQASIAKATDALSAAQARSAALAETQVAAQSSLIIATEGAALANAKLAASNTLVGRSYAFFGAILPAIKRELMAIGLVMSANPWALAITAVTAAGTALYLYRDTVVKTAYTQQQFDSDTRDLVDAFFDGKISLEQYKEEFERYNKVLKDSVKANVEIRDYLSAIGVFFDSYGAVVGRIFDYIGIKIDWVLSKLGFLPKAFELAFGGLPAWLGFTKDTVQAIGTVEQLAESFALARKNAQDVSAAADELARNSGKIEIPEGLKFTKNQEELYAKLLDQSQKLTVSEHDRMLKEITDSRVSGKEKEAMLGLLAKIDDAKAKGLKNGETEKSQIKEINDLVKAAIESQISDIKRLTDAKMESYAIEADELKRQYDLGKISADKLHTETINRIYKERDERLAALEQTKTKYLEIASTQAGVQNGSTVDGTLNAIMQVESSGGRNIVGERFTNKKGELDIAIGSMQTLLSTLRDPGWKMNPFKPLMDEGLKASDSIEKITEFANRNKSALEKWGKEYWSMRLGMGHALKDIGDGTESYNGKVAAAMSGTNTMTKESLDLTEQLKQLDAERFKINMDASKAEIAANRALIDSKRDYQDSLEQERLKLLQLTGTERAYRQAQEAYDLAHNRDYQAAKLDTTNPQNAKVFEDVSKAKLLRADAQAAEEYNQKLIDISKSTKEIGINSSQTFDLIHQGLGGVSRAFDDFTKSLKDIRAEIVQNAFAANQVAADTSLTYTERQGLLEAYTDKANKLEKDKTDAALTGIRQIVGATEEMFEKGSSGRKALHTLTITLGAIELAQRLSSSALTLKQDLIDMASAIKKTAVSVMAGAAKMFEQSGWFGFAGVAAMLGVMAAIGFSGSGGGGSKTMPTMNDGTGTVLGDSGAVSESGSKTYQLLKDIHAAEYAELRGINRGISALNSGITSVITRVFQSGGFQNVGGGAVTELSGLGKMIQAGSLIGKMDPISNFLLGGIFGKVTTEMIGSGIAIGLTPLMNVLNGMDLNAYQFATIKTTKKSWFSSSTRYSEQTADLSDDVQGALNVVFQSMGSTMFELAKSFGGDTKAKVEAYVIPAMKIDLQGLSAKEASEKLNGVISSVLDKMATDVFGDIIGQYQQLGEGMLETAVRIVSEVAVVKDALAESGLSLAENAIAISDAMVQAAGGLQAFQSAFEAYYDKFYTDEEKRIRLQEKLNIQLTDLSVVLPESRDGYRAMIEALDMTNEKDQQRYALLISLSAQADKYYTAMEAHVKSLNDAVSSAKSNLLAAYNRESQALTSTIDKMDSFIKSLSQFRDALVVGDLAASSPAAKYNETRRQFEANLSILQNGPGTTDASKAAYDAAISQFQSLSQAFLSSSRDFNASGMGYKTDYQRVLDAIKLAMGGAEGVKTDAELQLQALKDLVSPLVEINTSVLSVKDAIDALALATAEIDKYNKAQKEVANKNAYNAIENARKDRYDAPIAKQAAEYGQRAGKQGTIAGGGWSADTSINPFGASATVDAMGNISNKSVYGSSGEVTSAAAGHIENIANKFSKIGKIAQELIGGVLPSASISISDAAGGGTGTESYTFNGITRSLNTDDINPLISLFANDAVDYLAGLLPNKEWAKKIQAVSFSSLNSGFADLYTLMQNLKHPFKTREYDPKKDYTKINGSHETGLDYVPWDGYIAQLHKGERVLTAPQASSYNQGVGDSKAIVDELRQLRAELKEANRKLDEANRHAAANVQADVAGFKKIAEKTEKQTDAIELTARRARITESA